MKHQINSCVAPCATSCAASYSRTTEKSFSSPNSSSSPNLYYKSTHSEIGSIKGGQKILEKNGPEGPLVVLDIGLQGQIAMGLI